MAERSFVEEVKKLRLGEGEVFSGEGILAVTKALLESGVSYVAGYQGAPISHLMDVLADAQDILQENGIRFENSASEATAAATLAASVNYPLRGAVTFKATVGTNVASDALANLASGGVKGGALVIVGEDYGEGSSIMQERSHAFAMKSQMWLLDPRPSLPCIVQAVKDGFDLSEASNTPVMLQLRIRACHVHGQFVASDNKRAKFTLKEALENPERDVNRIVLPPASFLHEQEKIRDRWPNAVRFIQERGLNEFLADGKDELGIIVPGGDYNTAIRALEKLGLADVYGQTDIPLYVMNVVYPVVDEEVLRFCQGKRAVLLLEQGQPNFLEQNMATILRREGCDTALHGKDVLPMAGEYNTATMVKGMRAFFERYGRIEAQPVQRKIIPLVAQQVARERPEPVAPGGGTAVAERAALAVETDLSESRAAVAASVAIAQAAAGSQQGQGVTAAVEQAPETDTLDQHVHARPPGFCTGCPERPIFTAMKLVERELGPHHVSADIGCHLFSILPPFNLGNTTMGYGLGGAGAAALNTQAGKRAISVMGDGGFWHNGLVSGVANAVFNRSDNLTIVIDNSYTSATGGQDILSSKALNATRSTGHEIEKAVRGVGAEWVRTVKRTYDLKTMTATLREALTTSEKGPKVLVAQSECMLNLQRREKPKVRKAMAAGERVVRERFGVDPDTCTGDHSCIRLSGCPSLSIRPNPDPLRTDPVARVMDSCVGCGLCGEVSHAAVLCPSFYRAQIITNPTRWDKFRQKLRTSVIGWLQRRDAERRARLAF
ncbi:thiamine pyrophosphate-dependent enzyme [Kerstersia similis]|uniref:thiamine pyrophosphate-dependent enzyme n=1 Tax=Kerstersia similis TaxID=206505 RepID=UPI0039EF98AB